MEQFTTWRKVRGGGIREIAELRSARRVKDPAYTYDGY